MYKKNIYKNLTFVNYSTKYFSYQAMEYEIIYWTKTVRS